jgi:DNA-binding MarR family transcriptional regulator
MEPARNTRLVLLELLEDPPRHWSTAELQRQLALDHADVVDTLAELERAGLAHRAGGFALASRAAIECEQLLGAAI